MNIFPIIAALAVAVFGIAEILVEYEKRQMKKQFIQELDRTDDTSETGKKTGSS